MSAPHPIPVEWAPGRFVRFREVDRGTPVTEMAQSRHLCDRLRRPVSTLTTRRNLAGESVHADCIAAVENVAALCAKLGHELAEDAPGIDAAAACQAFKTIWFAGVAMVFDATAMYTGQAAVENRFEGLTWGFYRQGKAIAASQYMTAWLRLQQVSRIVARWLRGGCLAHTPELPIGTQLVVRFGDEATLLGLAAELERAPPWDRHRPKL